MNKSLIQPSTQHRRIGVVTSRLHSQPLGRSAPDPQGAKAPCHFWVMAARLIRALIQTLPQRNVR